MKLTDYLMQLSDPIGLIGVGLVLFAYFLLSTDKLSSQSIKYLCLNLVGSILILYSLLFHFNMSSVVIEIAWITISIIGLYRYRKTKWNLKIPGVWEIKND